MTTRGHWIEQGDQPSPQHVLSKTTAHILVTKSPLHAHLRKTRQHVEEPTEDMDLGNVVHAMLLGKGRAFAVAEWSPPPTADDALAAIVDRYEAGEDITAEEPEPAPKGKARKPRKVEPPPKGPDGRPEWHDWKRADAQAAKRAILAAGRIPLLPKHHRIAKSGCVKIRESLSRFGIVLDGVSEPGVSWFETTTDGTSEDVECWGALDHWRPRERTIYDLKIVRSAHPEACRKHLYAFGGDIQAAAYTSAVEAIHPELQGRVRFVFLFCELATGAVTPVELAGDYAHLGRLRWQRAINTWARCLRTDTWPGYASGTVTLGAPQWALEAEMAARSEDTERAWNNDSRPAGEDAGEEDEHANGWDEEAF